MREDAMPPGAQRPSLSARALQALASTQGWARFSGVAMLGAALLKAIQTGVVVVHMPARMEGQALPPAIRHGLAGGAIVGGLVTVAVYCVLGWLALRYAGRLNHVRPPRRPEPVDIAGALGAQHSYWRFQGIMMIVATALFVLVIVAAIAIGVIVAAARH